MNEDTIKAIIITTTCPNFKDGGILVINKETTKLPLEQALTRIERGIETNTRIRIPHKDYKGYTIIFPQFIVSYDVHMEEEI